MSTGDEKQPTNWGRVLTPVIGLVILVVCIGVGYVLSGPAFSLLKERVPSLPSSSEMQMLVGGGISVVLLLVFGMLYAMVAPKPEKTVSEAQLDKEKKERLAEQMRAKKLKRDMKNKMRQRNRE